jgi:ABC-2 type transport system permease protein
MNPVLLKELRSLLREKRGWLVPGIYASLLSAMVFFTGGTTGPSLDLESFGGQIAEEIAVAQTLAVVLIAPILGAAAIASERERGTWSRLLGAPISRWRIAAGKVAATSLYVAVMLLVSLPVASLAVLFGGMDPEALAGLYCTHALLGIALGCLGLGVSTLFHRTWVAAIVSVAMVAVLTFATFSFRPVGPPTLLGELVRCLNPAQGIELFLRGDRMESARRQWLLHYGALLAIAFGSVAFVTARVRSMVD